MKRKRLSLSPKRVAELQKLMRRLNVREENLEESFIRSSGPGGQRVNKVSTCVVIRHRPTGLEVRVQQERSQILNRYLARRWLLERLEAQRLREFQEAAQRAAKLRHQKAQRPLYVQERLLEAKRRQAKKKVLRRPMRWIED